jgi:hypothetical protein
MHVHSLDPAATYSDFAAGCGTGRLTERTSDSATDTDHADGCGRAIFQKSSAIEHGTPRSNTVRQSDFVVITNFTGMSF